MEKSVISIFKKGNVYTQGYAGVENGGGRIAYGPVFMCSIQNEDQLVRNLKSALEYSIQGVPHPGRDGWKEVQRPMLEAVGAKNWSVMARGAKEVGFRLKGEMLTMYPSCNYWDRGGTDLEGQEITVSIHSPELGKLIIKAFEISS